MLKIVTVPNKVLTSPTQKVKNITPKIRRLVEQMLKVLHDSEAVGELCKRMEALNGM